MIGPPLRRKHRQDRAQWAIPGAERHAEPSERTFGVLVAGEDVSSVRMRRPGEAAAVPHVQVPVAREPSGNHAGVAPDGTVAPDHGDGVRRLARDECERLAEQVDAVGVQRPRCAQHVAREYLGTAASARGAPRPGRYEALSHRDQLRLCHRIIRLARSGGVPSIWGSAYAFSRRRLVRGTKSNS